MSMDRSGFMDSMMGGEANRRSDILMRSPLKMERIGGRSSVGMSNGN